MSRPLTPLALTVLRMLCDSPMHPYEMQQRIRDHAYDQAVKITHGSLYHSVERLAAAGLIEPLETSREGRRPERTVYAVTTAGRDAAQFRLAELLARPSEEFPLFGTGLAFINLLPEGEVARLLRNRTVSLEAALAGHQAAHDSLRKQGIERYKLIDQEWLIARLRSELDYVRGIVDDLEAGRLTWKDSETRAICHPRPRPRPHHTDDKGAS
ncbi:MULTISPECIES: PadR family transcriptional regulator [Actinomadura]|uniref:DNA-binding transcriptional regulator, PadR family n=1 Tax=Actinomadura madurae TaxID=1993 RepID=A0A1I5DGA5_9ACTN|nr:PadR family transcriptional regulator [Actinomadura madurae]SFN98147.1 DNA-binding transcriptional regulator, PadR family [Actinomadura madurae]SPT50354.1 transcriptional regulator, Acidobacterial, PadR-family [Actinomadura madurae]